MITKKVYGIILTGSILKKYSLLNKSAIVTYICELMSKYCNLLIYANMKQTIKCFTLIRHAIGYEFTKSQ